MIKTRTYIPEKDKKNPTSPGQARPQPGQARPQHGKANSRRPRGAGGSAAHAPQKAARTVKARTDVLRFIPLGGHEEIGRNCSYFEYKDEIIVVDVGIQFPEEETPGIDFIIPNVASLEPKKKNIKGIILTHGHYDHIAAIHYVIEKLGNPIIYTTPFTKGIVEKRHEEFPNAPKLRFVVVNEGDVVKFSEHFSAEFIRVEHTIPEATGFILDTPAGKMVSFGDFRLEVDRDGEPQRLEVFEKLSKLNIHTLFMDSTNVEFPGFSMSEQLVIENLEGLIKAAPGRIILATFASLVDRLIEIISIAEKLGKRVAVNGRSMISNLDITRQLGYLQAKKDTMIPIEDVHKHRDDRVVILTTGSQGEQNAGLMRISRGEHRVLSLKPSDTVIFSSSVVPGNERSVQTLQDNISRQVDEVHNSKLLDIHASGHIRNDDAQLVISIVKPKFVVPIHGYYFKRKAYKKVAKAVGMDPKNVIMMDNGQVAEVEPDRFFVTEEKVPASYVMVDGLGVGDVEEVVLRDRLNLAQEGMVVMIVAVSSTNGRLMKNPEVLTRGFIHLKDTRQMIEEINKRIRGILSRLPQNQEVDPEYVKELLRNQIGQFLYTKTKRRPMILPVVLRI